MAEKTQLSKFRQGLRRLFSDDVIIRHVGKGQLKTVDTDGKKFNKAINGQGGKYGALRKSSLIGASLQMAEDGSRKSLFADYESMENDPIIASALDVYSDECTTVDEFGDLLVIKSENESISEILNNLFYDILNIDFNLWNWIRNMCKYGDTFLQLEVHPEVGIVRIIPIPVDEIERIEGLDPENPGDYFFTLGGNNLDKLMNFEVAHFRLLSDTNYMPYGKSMIEAARHPWKQLSLMEDAMLLHRIMRSPEKRVFKVDIGNIPNDEVDSYMNDVITSMKKTPFIDEATGEYNLKFNMENMLEDLFLPVRGDSGGTEVDTLSGTSFDAIDDVEYLKNRMMAALKIPKAFLGYEEGIEGKATLAAMDLRFTRTIERLQRTMVSELYKIATIHLYSQGFRDEALVDFNLNLTSPSLIYEEEKLAIWDNKAGVASSLQDLNMISTDYIYEKVFNMSPAEAARERKKVLSDKKWTYNFSSMADDGEISGDDSNEDDNPFESVNDDDDGNEKPTKSISSNLFGVSDLRKDMGMDKSSHKHRYKGGSPLSLEGLQRHLDQKANDKKIL